PWRSWRDDEARSLGLLHRPELWERLTGRRPVAGLLPVPAGRRLARLAVPRLPTLRHVSRRRLAIGLLRRLTVRRLRLWRLTVGRRGSVGTPWLRSVPGWRAAGGSLGGGDLSLCSSERWRARRAVHDLGPLHRLVTLRGSSALRTLRLRCTRRTRKGRSTRGIARGLVHR